MDFFKAKTIEKDTTNKDSDTSTGVTTTSDTPTTGDTITGDATLALATTASDVTNNETAETQLDSSAVQNASVDPDIKSKPVSRGMNDWRPFLYGGLASIVAECGTFPIDTTKTRLQVQGQVIDASLQTLKYRGMLHAFVQIFKEEGAHALYSGLAPALLRQATYGTIKIGVYHTLKRALISDPADETLATNVFCGVVAGITSSTIANPTDVLKVRMQATGRGSGGKCDNMVCSFAKIYKTEGVKGLWRGVGPTAQRAAVVAGVELPAYDLFKKQIILSGYLGDCKETHFIASFCAGFVGALASNPIDVCKTRMMNQKNLISSADSGVTLYKSSLDCLVRTVKTEGFMALYKGFIPNWLRLGPWNIIFFMTYEQLKATY